MITVHDKSLCSGCGACFNICPENCIKMCEDSEGFLYPEADKSKCIDCGLCEKACPIFKEYKGNPEGRAYACINKDESVRMESSSGGIFRLIAEYVLAKGGVVFGAAFDEDLTVHHILAESPGEIYKLQGSKYVQSRIENTYKKAKEYLENGRMVLFTGTPCQISGIKAYLNKDYENLILQDIVCHGVPSGKVWKKYVNFREAVSASKTRRTFFRHKKNGWKTFSVLFEFSNSTEYVQIFSKDLYMQTFLRNVCLRPSCYSCRSKAKERESDITLADFWGIENINPEMSDDKGTSLVLANSQKGQAVIEAIKDKMLIKEVKKDEALKYNKAAYESVKCPKERKMFFERLDKMKFDKLVKKTVGEGFLKKVKFKLKLLWRS